MSAHFWNNGDMLKVPANEFVSEGEWDNVFCYAIMSMSLDLTTYNQLEPPLQAYHVLKLVMHSN